MDLIIYFEVANQFNIIIRDEFNKDGPNICSVQSALNLTQKQVVGVLSWANGNRGQYNLPTAMKPESSFSGADPFPERFKDGSKRSWKENSCHLIFYPTCVLLWQGTGSKCTLLPGGGHGSAAIRAVKLPFIKHLLCARHCAEDFLNLIFIVKMINVHNLRSQVDLQSLLQKTLVTSLPPSPQYLFPRGRGSSLTCMTSFSPHNRTGTVIIPIYSCWDLRFTGFMTCPRSCS